MKLASREHRTSGRELRVGDFLRKELAEAVQREMRDPRVGMLSITDVVVSRDLSYADVYFTSVSVQQEKDKDEDQHPHHQPDQDDQHQHQHQHH